ncbi:hypothetical protein GWO43_11385 [candidate division KSB1 bacterium]|nr:hypothetical protein [candidate division KSB1 bacterium]NIR70605.1 hypothetical protein [candidate division KSB1 bacterium]NIS24550.1 hypothetical protein [candidate division KSB1 bacterium]NIT71468.1 hypothetical protein [candidate division KSB1 bacterium]NIU25159.1 hypothetical protein [candidate division KSB1 bacterium]
MWILLLTCCLDAAPAEPRQRQVQRDSALNHIHAFDEKNLIVVGDDGAMWKEVVTWESFAKWSLGKRLVDAADGDGRPP